MHRVINKTPPNLMTDHINGNKLDNRKSNLRSCNRNQNSQAFRKISKTKSSKYRGVSLHKRKNGRRDRFDARIGFNGKIIYLGSSFCEKEAALMYNKAALIYFKQFAFLNEIN